jgi:hypothetical protein
METRMKHTDATVPADLSLAGEAWSIRKPRI